VIVRVQEDRHRRPRRYVQREPRAHPVARLMPVFVWRALKHGVKRLVIPVCHQQYRLARQLVIDAVWPDALDSVEDGRTGRARVRGQVRAAGGGESE